jgi:hypothetical protein
MIKNLFLLTTAIALGACAGIRHTNNQFTTHAESFRIIGLAIPHDDQAAARELVPQGAKITDISSTPADWTSVRGFFGNLFSFHWTSISGTK